MNIWQRAILNELHERRRRGVRQPNSTISFLFPIYRQTGLLIGDRSLRKYLGALEAMGLVCRPYGRRSGWVLTDGHIIQLPLLPVA